MASNVTIPGLGQLQKTEQPPETSTTSNLAPDILAAAASIDVDMDVDVKSAETIQPKKEDHQPEVKEEMPQPDATTAAQKSAVTVNEASEDHDMKDAETMTIQSTAHIGDGNDVTASAPQPTETAQDQSSPTIKREEGEAKTAPAPPSPGVTHALEAALDGLLGPEPDPEAIASAAENAQAEQRNERPADAHPEWEEDSSPYSSSSSDDSSSDSDDSDEAVLSKLGIEETARLLMENDAGSDDEADGAKAAKQAAGVRTKNEQPDVPDEMPDVTITPDETILRLGIVQHIVEGTQVVIEALKNGAEVTTILDRGTVLCKEDRTVVGIIHDTIATVHKPMYIISYRTEATIKDKGIEKGLQIWYPKKNAVYVFPAQLRQEKGSDASNLHDEEVGPDEREFSDDEQELAYKREKKNRKRGGRGKFKNTVDDNESRPGTSPSGNPSPGLNYDEDEDGPYRVLPRPPNFGLGLPPPPPPSTFPPNSGNRGGSFHGRRGDFRGRGSRGRGFGGRGRGGGHGQPGSLPPQPPQTNQQPPPPFGANTQNVPGRWPLSMPGMLQFGAAPPPPPPPAVQGNAGYQMPIWTASQATPFSLPSAIPAWNPYAPPNAAVGGYAPAPATQQYQPAPNPQQQPQQLPTPTPPAQGYQYPAEFYSAVGRSAADLQQRWR